MKLIFGILATTLSLSAFAQNKSICSIPEIKTQARDFLWAESVHQVRLLEKGSCLDQEITKQLQKENKSRNLITERNAIISILMDIKKLEMAGYMKCISTDTPGCIDPDDEDGILEYEADLKRLNPLEGKDW